MNRAAGSEIEMNVAPGLEVAPQPDKNMYYLKGGESDHPVLFQPDHSTQSSTKSQGRPRAIWILAGLAVLLLAVALGAGLGVGLANQHRSTSSSALITGTNASSASIIVTETSNALVTITESGIVNTITTTPTSPSLVCPSANGSTYTATNKPLPTIGPQWNWHITNTSLFFEILCFTHYVAQDSRITDLQIFANVSSLNDCLDLCALYNFNARLENFPALGCTGIALGTGANLELAGDPWHTCWLKSNVTLGSLNDTATHPGYDETLLLNF